MSCVADFAVFFSWYYAVYCRTCESEQGHIATSEGFYNGAQGKQISLKIYLMLGSVIKWMMHIMQNDF